MIAYRDVGELVALALRLERKLKDFYDVAEIAVKNAESRRLIAALRERLEEKLAVLSAVDPSKFGRGEFLKYAPELREEDVVPVGSINRASAPSAIVSRIIASEERLRTFYAEVAGKLVARDQKELFAALVSFKEDQIADIKRLQPLEAPRAT